VLQKNAFGYFFFSNFMHGQKCHFGKIEKLPK
jgi:hypothetical protein